MPPKKKRKQSLEDAKTLKMINKPKRGDGHVLSSVLTTRLVPRQTVRGTLVVVKEESDLQVERRYVLHLSSFLLARVNNTRVTS